MLTIHYGSYQHDNGTATIETRLRTIFDEDNEDRRGIGVQWTIRGVLVADGAAALAIKKDALEAAYAVGDLDMILNEDGTPRASLLTADCKGGTRVTDGPNFDDSKGGVWVTHLPFNVTVEGDIFDGESVDSEIIELEERTTYTIGQHLHTTITLAGRLRVKDEISARTKTEDRDPRTTGIIPAGYQRMGSSVEINEDDDEATYQYRDWEWWKELPTDVTGGGYTTRRLIENINSQRVVVTGQFTGSGAQDGADAAKIADASYDLIREEQTVNEYNGSISFTYEYFDRGASDDLIFFEQSIVLQPSGTSILVRPVLNPGTDPVRQEIATIPGRATQSGRAIRTAGYQAFPSYAFNSDYFDPTASSLSKKTPRKGPTADKTEYETTWTYTFLLPSQTSVPSPAFP